ncbi:MAG: UDP-galactopyranose mutase [Bacilli bacterium]
MNYKKYDVIVIGAGFAGATIAERMANGSNKKVLVIDKREHIAGNMYDYKDENGIIIHKYGPHLFHTNIKEVYEYLSNFTQWFNYEHRVLGKVNGKFVPIPFNLTSIEQSFDTNKAEKLKKSLLEEFELDKKIPILELRKSRNVEINELAEFIYENVFLYYTLKQWGQKPDEIDPNVTNRVPVFLSRDDRYFQDKYQYMPLGGYTQLIKKMLDNKNIDIRLNTNAVDLIKIKDNKILIEGEEYKGKVIYTGAIDELFEYKYGTLPYRSLNFEFETINKKYYQPVGTVNYPTKEDKFTRITEYKHMTVPNCASNKTVIMREYPCSYDKDATSGNIPYYPIENQDSLHLYNRYLEDVQKINNLYLLGRLAQYKYYNMDLVINEALKLYDELKGEL